jgi:hypothetical protein
VRIVTFAPSLSAVEEEAGGLALRGFPMTSGYVDVFPAEIVINIVVAVCTLNGDEYDPIRYIIASSPSGERISTMQFGWHWDDNPNCPVKFRAFNQQLPIVVESEGAYTLTLCEDPDAIEDDAPTFPLQMIRNPMAAPPDVAGLGTLLR